MQAKPIKKNSIVISDLSSKTYTASLASCNPFLPLKNLPTPNTLQVAAFKIATNSKPMAHAVIDR